MNAINVAYICNNAYMPMTGISIYSLLENNLSAKEINIYLVGDNISRDNLDMLIVMIEHYKRKFYYIDAAAMCQKLKNQNIKKYKGKTYSPYLKNMIVEEISKNINRLLYIDSDTIITGSLEDLFSMELVQPLYMVADTIWDFYKKHLGMTRNSFYYNTGVILYNIPIWKESNCHARYFEFLENSSKQYVLADQDISNILFGETPGHPSEIGTLSLKYNYYLKRDLLYLAIKESKCQFYSKEEIEEAGTQYAIYHCAKYNGERPWEKGNQHPFKDIFDYYREKSPWSDMELWEQKIPAAIRIQTNLQKLLPSVLYTFILRIAQRYYFYINERNLQ